MAKGTKAAIYGYGAQPDAITGVIFFLLVSFVLQKVFCTKEK